ncbi:MAG: ribokinase [Chloroflexales bacterium]|nr:ribokinase [Chloroflexales bacterium]
MDLVIYTPRLPVPGETISGGPFATYPGGKGANQAVAAARLGAQVAMIGRVGQDAFGAAMQAAVAEAGVNVAYIDALSDVATGVALIAVETSGQNTIIIAPGANDRLTPADIDAAADAITAANLLVLQLETPLPAVQRAAAIARSAGKTVILNPAPAQPLSSDLLELVDYLIPNEYEATILLGGGTTEDKHPIEQAEALQVATGVSSVVLTLGAQGATLVGSATAPDAVCAHQVKAIDATAAGDAFVAAFAVALSEGRSPPEALRWGNAAGALTTTRLGAQPALPSRAEIERLMEG